jgi:MYND finger
LDQREIRKQEELFDGIAAIEMLLEKRAASKNSNISSSSSTRTSASSSSSHDGALLLRFRQQAMYTSRNIQALFHMCDPDIRTGPVQRCALEYLTRIGSGAVMISNNSIKSIWRLEILPPAQREKALSRSLPPSSSSSFGLQLITVAAKALLTCPTTSMASSSSSSTAAAAWRALDLALVNTVLTVSPGEMVKLLNSIDWPALFQKGDNLQVVFDKDHDKNNGNELNHHDRFVSHQNSTFVQLHKWARRLLAMDPNNTTATTFLQQQLGSCSHGLLLHPFLECAVRGCRYQHNGGVVCWTDAQDFLLSFMNCLVPLAVDHVTVALVDRARHVLNRCLADTIYKTTTTDYDRDENIRIMLALLERWQGFLQYTDESDRSRLLQFRNDFKLDDNDASSTSLKNDQQAVKKTMKNNRNDGNAHFNLKDGEMCANCSILESQCRQEESSSGGGRGLLSCARCIQIKYCSVKCQVEHWNKEQVGHKNHCERVKYYSFSP